MNKIGRFIVFSALCCVVSVSAFAQQSIPGKVFVAELAGTVTFIVDGKVVELKKGLALPAPGARIETAAGAHVVLVYSNGTSIYIDEKTIVEIREFVQRPFPAGIDTSEIEPSVSSTVGYIRQGRIIITTNQLVTGTSMVYLTPECQVKVRGKDVVIEVLEHQTRVGVIRGDVTVTPSDAPAGAAGLVLHDGQMVIISEPAGGAGARTVRLEALDANLINALAALIAANERAQRIVVFESVPGGAGGPQIQAKEVVPADLPVQLTVSPSSLRTGS
jgi:hypothetical protein